MPLPRKFSCAAFEFRPNAREARIRFLRGQVLHQLVGAGVGIGLAVAGTLAALKITEMLTPLRMDEREEVSGMDLSLHSEEGYNFEA